MDGIQQASFIPKKPISPMDSGLTPEGSGFSLITFFAVILFIGAAALSIFVFLYQRYLDKKLNDPENGVIAQYKLAEAAFDPNTVKELKRLDTRLVEAEKLMQNHVAMSSLLKMLEAATIKQVQFLDFKVAADTPSAQSVGSAKPAYVKLDLRGIAVDYGYLAIQSDVFNETKGFKEPIFSNISPDEKNNINFQASVLVDLQELRYNKLLDKATGN